MLKSDLQPPFTGLNADPVLYGVASGLADLFPPIDSPSPHQSIRRRDVEAGHDPADEDRDRD